MNLACYQNITYQEALEQIGIQFSEAVKRNVAKLADQPSPPPPQHLGQIAGLACSPNRRLDSMSRDMSVLKLQFASLQ